MTLPREVVPGRDYMITRRCSERRFFLRPDETTNNAFIYCLALAASHARLAITFTQTQSNHHHTGVHDEHGTYPEFTEYFHGLLARCQNAHLGRFEGFWSSEPTSVVHLVNPEDILDKMVYAFTNPCAADLVDSVEAWPGVSSFNATLSGGELVAKRPKHFFREEGDLPKEVRVPIARPTGFEHLSQEAWAALVTERVRAKEAEHRERREASGVRVLGRRRVLRQDPFSCPKSHAPHFKLNPRVAAKSKWARIEALLRNRAFLEKYRAAFKRYLAGAKQVLFPYGTYWMQRFAMVSCEPPEAPAPLLTQQPWMGVLPAPG